MSRVLGTQILQYFLKFVMNSREMCVAIQGGGGHRVRLHVRDQAVEGHPALRHRHHGPRGAGRISQGRPQHLHEHGFQVDLMRSKFRL